MNYKKLTYQGLVFLCTHWQGTYQATINTIKVNFKGGEPKSIAELLLEAKAFKPYQIMVGPIDASSMPSNIRNIAKIIKFTQKGYKMYSGTEVEDSDGNFCWVAIRPKPRRKRNSWAVDAEKNSKDIRRRYREMDTYSGPIL